MLDDLKISYYHVSHCISHQVNHKKRSALSVLFAITYPFNIKMDHLSLLISEVGMTCMNLNISDHSRAYTSGKSRGKRIVCRIRCKIHFVDR